MDTEVHRHRSSAPPETIRLANESTKDLDTVDPTHTTSPEFPEACVNAALSDDTTPSQAAGDETKGRSSKDTPRKPTKHSKLSVNKAPLDAPVVTDSGTLPNIPSDENELQEEKKLTDEIGRLWSSQVKKDSAIRRTRQELTQLRLDLGKYLAEYKTLTARTGRAGQWNAFLRGQNIPRTSADRLVRNWKLSWMPKKETAPRGAVCPPTTEDVIVALIKKLKPRVTVLAVQHVEQLSLTRC